ncbi:MAG TPA: hypothetical protein VKA07_13050 [Candidatus Sulfotelmatobacter sp.]|nr:hypothetical protein [Candidatus Sulfotelmatobacter sp.]
MLETLAMFSNLQPQLQTHLLSTGLVAVRFRRITIEKKYCDIVKVISPNLVAKVAVKGASRCRALCWETDADVILERGKAR